MRVRIRTYKEQFKDMYLCRGKSFSIVENPDYYEIAKIVSEESDYKSNRARGFINKDLLLYAWIADVLHCEALRYMDSNLEQAYTSKNCLECLPIEINLKIKFIEPSMSMINKKGMVYWEEIRPELEKLFPCFSFSDLSLFVRNIDGLSDD